MYKYYNKFPKKSSLSFKDILEIIAGKTNYQPKQYGNGYICRCTAHEDKNPSLSASIGKDGKILLYCFAGCHYKDICNSIGISISNLFSSKNRV
jgi:uncharacterized ParB-like nuclease family protein